jgi:hypothetical protein
MQHWVRVQAPQQTWTLEQQAGSSCGVGLSVVMSGGMQWVRSVAGWAVQEHLLQLQHQHQQQSKGIISSSNSAGEFWMQAVRKAL